MSFLIDPPALVASGVAIARLPLDERTARMLERGVAALFVGGATALYLNAPGTRWMWRPFGSSSGRDFMLNSGITSFEHRRPPLRTHVAAALLLASYPLFLRLGRHLGARRRGP